jgi:KEOPS complex subunit Cgi121
MTKIVLPEFSYKVCPCTAYVENVPAFLSELVSIGEKIGYHFVLLRRESMAGFRHVHTAVRHAIRSFGERPIAKTLEIEILLFAAATRQTGMISAFGVQQGDNDCYLCVVPRNEQIEQDPWSALEKLIKPVQCTENTSTPLNDTQCSFFCTWYRITPQELALVGRERLEDLVCERVALLSLNK